MPAARRTRTDGHAIRGRRAGLSRLRGALTPQERTGVFLDAGYNINDSVELYASALHNNTKSGFQIAPLPMVANNDGFATSANNPFGISFGSVNAGGTVGSNLQVFGHVNAPLIEIFGGDDIDHVLYTPQSQVGRAKIYGGAGDDDIVLDRLPTIDLARKFDGAPSATSLVTGRGVDPLRFTVDVDGQGGTDTTTVFTTGSSDADRAIVAQGIGANDILTVNAGTYHIVSYFGDVNAVVRADLRVEPGQLTDATLYHRAAQTSFKLVSEAGGEAIADVDWTVKTTDGTTIFTGLVG